MLKYPSLIDVPVFLFFFVRPSELSLSFEAIKKARPSTLFLVSDGPRNTHPNDKNLNDKCKQIVAKIDWECVVYHKYSDTNKGMYITAFEGFKWAFEKVDRFILIEDDVVPHNSFFKYCEILLKKYENDLRVHYVCGMNQLGEYDKPTADYFFSKVGSVWGFAMWKRTYDDFEYNLAFSDDKYAKNLLTQALPKNIQKVKIKEIEQKRNLFLNSNTMGDFELVSLSSFFLQNGLMIVPTKNLISSHGISENAVHNVNNPKKQPKAIRRLFEMKTHEVNFPITHPKYVIADTYYEKEVYKIMGNSKFVIFTRRLESIARQIFYGNNSERLNVLKKIFR